MRLTAWEGRRRAPERRQSWITPSPASSTGSGSKPGDSSDRVSRCAAVLQVTLSCSSTGARCPAIAVASTAEDDPPTARTYASSSTWRGSWGALPARGAEKGSGPSRAHVATCRPGQSRRRATSTFCRPDGRQTTTGGAGSIPSLLFGRLPLMLLSVALFSVP